MSIDFEYLLRDLDRQFAVKRRLGFTGNPSRLDVRRAGSIPWKRESGGMLILRGGLLRQVTMAPDCAGSATTTGIRRPAQRAVRPEVP